MNKARCLSLAVAAAAMAFTVSCTSGDSGGGGGGPIKKPKISGVSQKGPFVEGTRATLYELDGDFAQTGRQFFDIIADSKGTFEIKNVELISPYAAFEADGFYRNEVTGGTSAAPIKLYAIADIREKDNVNVNLLTHLEYYRVLNLVESGNTVAEAKKQAQKEILAVFGISGDNFANSEDMSIFGTTEGDAALLAISVLLQGNLPEGEFSQRLTNFAQSLKTSGTWENEAEKTKMSYWAFEADLAGIKSNVLEWGLSLEVPGFEKYVSSWKKASYKEVYCSVNDCRYFTDSRDNQKYTYVEIGGQSWMAENLNYSGDDGKLGVCYNNDLDNCKKYGRLYNWEQAMEVCPNGWHLSTNEEWSELNHHADSTSDIGSFLISETANIKLKSANGWNSYNGVSGNGTDEFGFSALPGGNGDPDGSFADVGNYGNWWTANDRGSNTAYLRLMYHKSFNWISIYKEKSLSVRCVKD